MRRMTLVIPMILLTGACDAPAAFSPGDEQFPSRSISAPADSTWTADTPSDSTRRGDGGIMIGSGT